MHYKFNSGETLDRQPWFDCSCCPTNMCRFIASLPGYIYAQGNNSLYVNLFTQSSSTLQLNKKLPVTISQETQYPWVGQVKITVSPEKASQFTLCLRISVLAGSQVVPSYLYSFITPETESVSVTVNGEPVQYKTEKGYAVIDREWKLGDVVNYSLPMNIRRVVANQNVADDLGKVAIERGPIVYCFEGDDNGQLLSKITVPDGLAFSETFDPNTLGGVVTISGEMPLKEGKVNQSQKITAIPYFAWDNRGGQRNEGLGSQKVIK